MGTFRSALVRLAQFALFAGTAISLARQVWLLATFPQDGRSWLAIVALAVGCALPVTIWWREQTGSRIATFAERVAAGAASLVGGSFFVAFLLFAGWLFTGPYSGPMSAEATIFLLIIAFGSAFGGLLLLVAPLLLDCYFFSQGFRHRAWRILGYALPSLAVLALSLGHRFDSVFR